MGLNEEQVLESRKKHGSNSISNNKKNSFIKDYLIALGDPIIRILLIALAIKTIFLIKQFDWYETIGIVIAIFLASFISTISEYGSEKAFLKLQEESSKLKCKIKRSGKVVEKNIDEVVVNDIILLESGDKIPADGMIIEGTIGVDESSISGESKEIYKHLDDLVFRGTVVLSDRATIKVIKVGNDTFYGTVFKELTEDKPISPLKMRLTKLAQFISKIGYMGAILVFISYLFSKIVIQNNFNLILIKETITNIPQLISYILYGLTLCVTVIIVAVPEGLPMMITLVLSSNMKRMLKDNVLVRKLNGIETAGSINILFSDKTGTLTKGKLKVTDFVSADLKEYKSLNSLNEKLRTIVELSFIYNNASEYSENNIIGGNITDKSILEFINIKEKDKYKIIEITPFNSLNKYSASTVLHNKDEILLVKGAPEVLLDNCSYYYDSYGNRAYFNKKVLINDYLRKKEKIGYRIICFATSKNEMKDMTLVGFALIKDEVRPEVNNVIKQVKEAGVHVIMVTGDNKDTAVSIAKEIKLLNDNELVLTSSELAKMTDEEVKKSILKLRVVARAVPQDKSRLVRLSQEMDFVVGMTGDGINDAPALKKADVGFAMGSGSEVAKEASEIVILDNNFLSISKAILYGRTIFKSIRKFIIFQLTVNICAVSLSIVGPFIGIDTPVTVIQMLWINMVMDTLAAIAFAFEPALNEYMNEPPKKRDEEIINKYMKHEIFITGIYSCLLCILFLKIPLFTHIFRDGENNKYLMTAFFGLFIFMGIFNSFNARTHRLNILAHLFKNKAFITVISFVAIIQVLLIYFGGDLFRTAGLTFFEFQIMFLLALTVIPFDFLRKSLLRKKGIIGGV